MGQRPKRCAVGLAWLPALGFPYRHSAKESVAPGRPFKYDHAQADPVYSARDQVDNEEWLAEIEQASDRLGLGTEARSYATDLFLSHVPEADRSKRAIAAASLYAGSLVAGEGRTQTDVADAMGVARLSVQQHWKPILRDAGFDVPDW
jgi:hypothetical protein